MKYTIPISFLLHSLVLIIALLSPDKGSQAGKTNQPDVQIISVVTTQAEDADNKKGLTIKKVKQKKFKSKVKCEQNSWFGGIGIQENMGDDSIDVVFPGYPADKAGLLSGDVIMAKDSEIRGDPGTVLNLTISRPSTNESLTFRIIRDRICYGERKR
jgi:predicted metalloprotease with PDZ domain